MEIIKRAEITIETDEEKKSLNKGSSLNQCGCTDTNCDC